MAAPPGTSAGMHKLTNVEAQRIMAILEESWQQASLNKAAMMIQKLWRGRVARRDFEKKKKGGKGGKGKKKK